jgi:hypothetical protein
VIGLYKTELIRRRGPWRTQDDVELATLEYLDWFNQRRLHSSICDVPPAEFEAMWSLFSALAHEGSENRALQSAYSHANDRGGTGHRANQSAFASLPAPLPQPTTTT